jgi:branched-chain amino acid aminotransferase
VRVDKRWIPRGDGFSLYLRPTVISTWPYLGVSTAQSIKLFVVACPVGPYYATGFKPTTLYADAANVRAWPGGTGDSKLGGNYAPTIKHLNDVAARGFSQTLWLFGSGGGGQVTEVGTMNFFVVWRTPAGRTELATAPLDGTILPGVTRQSILDLARARWPDVDVAERHFTIADVADAAAGGRLLEAFGAGTAAVVSPVKKIHVAATGADIDVPCGASADGAGPIARRAWNELADIQYGRVAHPWSVVVG